MGQYDIALKSTFRIGGRGLLRHLGIDAPLWALDIEIASVKERRLDFLAEIGPGQLLHIEFQAAPDASLVFRMLGYYGEILERVGAERRALRLPLRFDAAIRQILINIGSEPWRQVAALDHPNLQFRFETVDAIAIDAAELLLDGDIGDAIFAVLCKNGASRAMIKTILDRILAAPPEQRPDAMAHLLVLSKLRQANAVIDEEYERMTLIVNVEDIKLLREPIDRAYARGKAEGEAEGVAKAVLHLLHRKFGALPPNLMEALVRRDLQDLNDMLLSIESAASIEAVIGEPLPEPRRS